MAQNYVSRQEMVQFYAIFNNRIVKDITSGEYGITLGDQYFKIDKKVLRDVGKKTIENKDVVFYEENVENINDKLVVLYLLNQECFYDKEIFDYKYIKKFEEMKKEIRNELKTLVKNNDDDLSLAVSKFAMGRHLGINEGEFLIYFREADWEDEGSIVNKQIHEFLLKLMNEKVLSEDTIMDSALFFTMDSDELINSYIAGLIPNSIMCKTNFFDDPEILRGSYEMGLVKDRDVINIYKERNLPKEQVLELLGGSEEVIKKYKKLIKEKNTKKANTYLEIMDEECFCRVYADGLLDEKKLEEVGINKENLMNLPEDVFVKMARRGFPKDINFESDELLDNYITKFSGSSLIALSKYGYIEPEKLFEMANKAQEEEKGFNQDEIKAYMNEYIDNCKSTMNETEYAKKMISLIDKNILQSECLDKIKFEDDALMNMFIDETLTEDKAIEFFNRGILNARILKIIYGEEYSKIISLVKQNRLDDKALLIIPNTKLKNYLEDSQLTTDDIFKIYSKYNGISIKGLSSIFEEYEVLTDERANVVDSIEKDTSIDTIKELRLYKILSHEDLFRLQDKGVITEENREELEEMDLAIKYKELFDGNKKIENLEEIYEKDEHNKNVISKNNIGEKRKQPEMSAKSRIDFFNELGAYSYEDIEPYNSRGDSAPFKNYRVIGFLEQGLIVLENLDQVGNATYLMTIQEFDTYVTKEADKTITFTKSKNALRSDFDKKGHTIDFCSHSKEWGNNVIEAMKRLSKNARETISKDKQESLATAMREEYRRVKEEQLKNVIEERDTAQMLNAKAIELERETEQKLGKGERLDEER